MVWSGLKTPMNYTNRLTLQIKRKGYLKARVRIWKHWTWEKKYLESINIHVPSPWDFIIFRKYSRKLPLHTDTMSTKPYRLLFLYSVLYYCICPIPIHWRSRFQNKFNSGIEITTRHYSHYTVTYFTNFTELFFALHRPIFRKLKFRGKGYYMYRNKRNTITPQLGHAHRILTYTFFLTVKFFRKGTVKRSILLVGRLKEHLYIAAWRIKQMRRQNIFTGRGVRFARGVIYRKPGKISTYR